MVSIARRFYCLEASLKGSSLERFPTWSKNKKRSSCYNLELYQCISLHSCFLLLLFVPEKNTITRPKNGASYNHLIITNITNARLISHRSSQEAPDNHSNNQGVALVVSTMIDIYFVDFWLLSLPWLFLETFKVNTWSILYSKGRILTTHLT